MKKKRRAFFLLILLFLAAGSACTPDYSAEFLAMTERYDEMDAAWSDLMEEEAALNAATPGFDTIDAYYDKATAQANADIDELKGMINTLESYREGINEKDYEEFFEVLSDALNTTEVAAEYLAFDRGWIKAKSINDENSALVEEWNRLKSDDKTAAAAQGYKTRMTALKTKLISIQDEIDSETYFEMYNNLDDAIDAFDDWVTKLSAEESAQAK